MQDCARIVSRKHFSQFPSAQLLLSALFWMMKIENKRQSIASPAEVVSLTDVQFIPFISPWLWRSSFIFMWARKTASPAGPPNKRAALAIGAASTIIPMFFWAGLLSGRGISVIMLHRAKEISVVISGLLLSAFGTVILLLAVTRSRVILGVLLAGLGLSSVYPIFIAWLSKWYGERARSLGAVMFSLASIGGATVPWIVGFVSQRASSLRVGLLVPLVGSLTMIAVVAVLRRRIVA